MSARSRPTAKTAFYLHLPKTGGTSLRRMFEGAVGRRQVLGIYDWETEQEMLRADRATFESYRLVVGHFRIAMWARTPDLQLITMLREPVERVASHYRYARSWDKDRFHDDADRRELVEFALADLGRSLNNCQTHNLSTADAPMTSEKIRARPPYGGLTAADADEAIRNLEHPSVLPGLHEAFAESVALASVWLDVEPPAIVEANRSPDRTGDRLSPTERAAIAQKNALDVRVYDAARDAFWDKWRAAGAEAHRALERVHRPGGRATRLKAWQETRFRQAKQTVRRLAQRSNVR
ncbi:MAG: hypothetical protein ACRDY4_07320 [Acidimicrobiia bacterium]